MNLLLDKQGNKIVLNDEQSDYVIKEYFNKERSMIDISKDFNCSPQVIARTIREKGLLPREVGASNRLYYAEDSYFQKINTEEKAYWLGFLCADGTINEKRGTVTLGLMSEDIEHIEKFRKAISSNNPIYEVKKIVDDKVFSSSRINIYSRQMVKDLMLLGCIPNKSLTLSFPSSDQVSDEYILHFMRGYFDGDGSISFTTPYSNRRQYRFSVLGTRSFIDKFKEKINFEHLKTQSAKNHFYIGTTGGKQTFNFLNKLYGEANIYLDRKYNKYMELQMYTIENPVVPHNKKTQ